MGKEAQCTCKWGKRVSAGKAMLETDEILFHGEFRVAIPLRQIKSIAAVDGELRIDSPQGQVTLSLGADAAKWADKVLNPPSRADKLGIKEGLRVAVIGLDDPELAAELKKAMAHIAPAKRGEENDLLFLGAEERADLKQIKPLIGAMKSSGAMWVVYPKGIKTITEMDVLTAGREAGLKDVKVARFSERQTALKFVVPVEMRKK